MKKYRTVLGWILMMVLTIALMVGCISCSNSEETSTNLETSDADSSTETAEEASSDDASDSSSVEEEEETWDSGMVTTAATCGTPGVMTYTSSLGNTTTERISATGEHTDANGDGICDDCGYIDMSNVSQEDAIAAYGYYVSDEDESGTYTTNDIILFGSYIQDEVEDETIQGNLNALVTTPEVSDEGWTSYGYYLEGEKADYAFYQDVDLDGETYRGVYFTEYRPVDISDAASEDNSYVDDNGYETNTLYWFEIAPISWIILDYTPDGQALLNSDRALSSMAYQTQVTDEGMVESNTAAYANDWAYSEVRSWLNDEFYNEAFSEEEDSLIMETTLDNANTSKTSNRYTQNQSDTQDKVFLLSYNDLVNTDYGFPTTTSFATIAYNNGYNDTTNSRVVQAMTRRRTFSDYAAMQGARTSLQTLTAEGDPCLAWTLRSAGSSATGVCGVDKYGSMDVGTQQVTETNWGVVPALWMKL